MNKNKPWYLSHLSFRAKYQNHRTNAIALEQAPVAKPYRNELRHKEAACLKQTTSRLKPQTAYFAESSISFHSVALNSTAADPTFSSRCSIEVVPGMGRITFDRCSSHASESCDTVA